MPCNAPNPPIYLASGLLTDDPGLNCRCVVCPRCNMHTGNSTQGHFWAWCKVTESRRDYHWCCEESCSLEVGDAE